jgi:type VI secretion system protein VasJ
MNPDAIIALGRDPVSAAAPAGENVRYDETFEQLQAQMDRIGSIAGVPVDWRKVVELSTGILKSKAKDLLVATYLTLGLFETEGYKGLAAGLDAYRELVSKYWEPCFPRPKPPLARINAIQYLSEKVMTAIDPPDGRPKRAPTGAEKEGVHKSAEAAIALDAALQAAYAGQGESPNFAPFVRAMKTLKERAGPLTAEAPAGAVGAEGGASGAAAPAAGGGATGAPVAMDSFRTPTQALQTVKAVAKFLLSQDGKDPTGYRLSRMAAFGPLTELPKDKLIPGPPAPRRGFFENLAGAGDWPQLLTEAEGQFGSTPLWLDMQRYVALALGGLGGAHSAARDAVLMEAAALFARMPGLFELTFKDNTPFADGATRAWIAQAAPTGGSGGSKGGAAASSGAGGDKVATAMREARKMLAESKPAEAVARLSSQVEASSGRRDRFRAQLALATLCLEMGRLSLAASLLEGLESVIDAYRLEEWEPDLAAEALYDLYECLTKANAKPTPEQQARLHAVFGRMARLDPATALKLESARKPG